MTRLVHAARQHHEENLAPTQPTSVLFEKNVCRVYIRNKEVVMRPAKLLTVHLRTHVATPRLAFLCGMILPLGYREFRYSMDELFQEITR